MRITDSSGNEAVLRNHGVLRGADNLIGYNALPRRAERRRRTRSTTAAMELARTRFVGNRSSARLTVTAASAACSTKIDAPHRRHGEGNSVLDANGGSRACDPGQRPPDGTGIVLRDNWPWDNWPQESHAAAYPPCFCRRPDDCNRGAGRAGTAARVQGPKR